MRLAELNGLSKKQFNATLAEIYEHSPWVAQTAESKRPFESLTALHNAMSKIVLLAPYQQQLELVLAHPELAGKAAAAGDMAEFSKTEQQGAGLNMCSPEELEQIQKLNHTYNKKFNFPFIIAVSGLNRIQIIKAMQTRLENSKDKEFATALDEINKIALIRLQKIFSDQ